MTRVLYLIHCLLIILHNWIHTLLELTDPEDNGEPIVYQLVVLEEDEIADWLGANNIVLEET